MSRLIEINSVNDIPDIYKNTPIGLLSEYHNLKRKFEIYSNPHLLIGTCMDNRVNLKIPGRFSCIIRAGGADLRQSEFKISFAIAIAGVKFIALIGHSNCGMVNLISKKSRFVEQLSEYAGWSHQQAEEHFNIFAPMFEINNELDFTICETKRLRIRYPKIVVAPMFYKVEDDLLYFIDELDEVKC